MPTIHKNKINLKFLNLKNFTSQYYYKIVRSCNSVLQPGLKLRSWFGL